jgi:hypothetical protein
MPRFTILRLMFGVAVVGIGLAFLKSLVTFLGSPLLMGDREEALWAPISFALRTLSCGVAFWVLQILYKRLRRRELDRTSEGAVVTRPGWKFRKQLNWTVTVFTIALI